MNRDLILNEVIRRNSGMLRNIIRKYFKQNEDDIYQDLCLHLLDKIRNAEEDELSKWSSGAWLNTVANNRCKDFLRHQNSKTYQATQGMESLNHSDDASEFDRRIFAGGHNEFETNDPSLSKYVLEINSVLKEFALKHPKDAMYIKRHFMEGVDVGNIGREFNDINPSQTIKRAVQKLKKMINSDALLERFDLFFSTDFDE